MFDTHCEKELIINGRELKYQGVFRPEELFSAINKALEEKSYLKREKKSEEAVTEGGRGAYIELRPYKEKTRYAALMLKIKIHFSHLTESVEMVRGEKAKFQKGDVSVIFDAWLLTDYEYRWGMKPWVYFFKGMINKFAYAFPMEAGFKDELQSDTAYIYRQVKELLDSYKGEKRKLPREEEVAAEVSKRVRKDILVGLRRRK